MAASDSILETVKQNLGIPPDYDHFDPDIIMHTNTVLATLTQLGVGPSEGFSISDSTSTWQEFIGDDQRLNMVQSYVYIRVRLLFDPPLTSSVIDALERNQKELEWRIQITAEFPTV